MFKKLVMLVFLGILLSFSVVNAQEAKDELPPLVIETDDLWNVGIKVDWDKNPIITVREWVYIYKDLSKKSPTVGEVDRSDVLSIIGAKAYVYPRIGKTKVIKDIALKDKDGKEKIVKAGDTIYLIHHKPTCYDAQAKDTVWYKGNFYKVNANEIKMPAPYYMNENSDIHAEYEGYTNKKDVEADFLPYLEYPHDDEEYPASMALLTEGAEFRRNADIWLYVEMPDKVTKGWVQLLNAYRGSKEDRQIWWKHPTAEQSAVFDFDWR